MSEPSIGEANKLIRVLKGERKKYTVQVHLPDGKVVEFQAEKEPALKWHHEARALWLHSADSNYNSTPIIAWVEGSILLVEENPKT